jgi:hypothetical protein
VVLCRPRPPINAVWLELALVAADLIAWTQTTLLSGDLAKPSRACATGGCSRRRTTRGQRGLFVRIAERSPWVRELVAGFSRLAALPRPALT